MTVSAIRKSLVIALLLTSTLIFAQNSMPIMQTFTGHYGNAWLGEMMTSINFNADGYDDLLLFTRKLGPSALWGAELFYGSAEIDTIPDLEIQSQFQCQLGGEVFMECGDVNGDGYQDLALEENFPTDVDSCMIHFYYSGPQADFVPDHTLIISTHSGMPHLLPRYAIGDINNDGFDDLGCQSFEGSDQQNYKLEILLGGVWQRVVVIGEGISTQRRISITGVDDVNGDGIDDFVVGYASVVPDGIESYRYLYYGGNPLNLENRVLLYSTLSSAQSFSGAFGIGDFNQDGYDDFVYCTESSWMDGNKLRLGGQNILETAELTLESDPYHNLMNISQTVPVYGDFNRDGCMDIAGSNYGDSFWDGIAGIWLGKSNPNGICDLILTPPPISPYYQFGWAMATGDFNGDGYDDLAISAPNTDSSWPFVPGYVHILAGNPQLQDTTVANDDPNVPGIVDQLQISANPNPFSTSTEIACNIPKSGKVKLCIYNTRSQLVRVLLDSDLEQGQHSIVWDGRDEQQRKVASGIYFLRLQSSAQNVIRKVLVLK